MRTLGFQAIFIFGVALVLASISGCASTKPLVLDAPKVEQPLLISAMPLFETIDASSFASAKGLYGISGAKGTYHSIPLGDYVAAELVRGISGKQGITRTKLVKFALQCDGDGLFMPRSICEGHMAVSITTSRKNQIFEVTVHTDVGHVYVADSGPLSATEGGAELIVEQVSFVAMQLVKAVNIEILRGLSRN